MRGKARTKGETARAKILQGKSNRGGGVRLMTSERKGGVLHRRKEEELKDRHVGLCTSNKKRGKSKIPGRCRKFLLGFQAATREKKGGSHRKKGVESLCRTKFAERKPWGGGAILRGKGRDPVTQGIACEKGIKGNGNQ